MKLSVIICVYNTDKGYLNECLRSVRESTLSHPSRCGREDVEYEIVMIDDGSDIDYSDLIEKYGVICTRTENRGILKARALGVKVASGDYIAFCDSDDTVSFNYHLPMLLKADECGADVVINDWSFNSPAGLTVCKTDSTIKDELDVSGDDTLALFLKNEGREHSYYVLWNKIYRADVLRRALEMTEETTAGFDRFNYSEDVLINFYAFKEAKRVVNIHTGYYFYRIHASQSVTVESKGTLKDQIKLISHTLSVMEREIKGGAHSPLLLSRISAWRGLMARAHYSHARANGFSELYPYIREAYGVKRLTRSTYKDERCYLKFLLLPANFSEIDAALYRLWLDGRLPRIKHPRCEYIDRAVGYMLKCGAVAHAPDMPPVGIRVVRPPFKKRLRSNATLLRIARVLFPKGSKMRKILKNRL